MSIQRVTEAVNQQNADMMRAQDEARDLAALVDRFRNAITAEAQVEHPPYPQQAVTLTAENIDVGAWLLIRAGQVSALTLNGLNGWHVDQATLAVENRSPRMAIYPASVPLLFEDLPGAPVYKVASITFDPPRHVRRILTRGGMGYFISYLKDGQDVYPLGLGQDRNAATPVNAKIAGIQMFTLDTSPFANRLALVQDNEAKGLAVLTSDDRLLHRAGQKLVSGQSATTPDLAATLNEATGDTVTFNLTSQSDCVIFIKGNLVRRRVAEGFTTEVPEVLPVGPWAIASATPTAAPSVEPQTVTLTGKIRKTGPLRMGLVENVGAGRQVVRAHPRLRLVQPFQPVATAQDAPLSLTGLWLFVDAVPEAETRLTVQITPWDARKNSIGAPLARASATLAAELGPYVSGPDGLLAAWVPFDASWALDPDDQALLHALVLSEIDGPAGLIEAPKAHPQLSPARFRDVSRSELLTTRGFGAAEKALLFDLGLEANTAPVVIAAGGGSQTIQAGPADEAFTVTLPRAVLTITADAAVEVTDLAARSATGPL